MDNQLGPKPLHQYPPTEKLLPKEKFLKIWARHETEDENNFIYFIEDKKTYLSLTDTRQNRPYFIVIVTAKQNRNDIRIYQEILQNVADELLNNLDNPQFNHILHDAYDTIKNYTQINEKDMFIRLFEDKIRVSILSILQNGTISKTNLKEKLKKEFGYANLNLELFLTPFLRLNLIEIKDIHGIKGVIFLKNDVFACYLPPKNKPATPKVVEIIQNRFKKPQIIPLSSIRDIITLIKNSSVKKLIEKLEESSNGLSTIEASNYLGFNEQLLSQMEDHQIIKIIEDRIHLISSVHFLKFKPNYLVKKLINRYEEKQISSEQFLEQLEILSKDK